MRRRLRLSGAVPPLLLAVALLLALSVPEGVRASSSGDNRALSPTPLVSCSAQMRSVYSRCRSLLLTGERLRCTSECAQSARELTLECAESSEEGRTVRKALLDAECGHAQLEAAKWSDRAYDSEGRSVTNGGLPGRDDPPRYNGHEKTNAVVPDEAESQWMKTRRAELQRQKEEEARRQLELEKKAYPCRHGGAERLCNLTSESCYSPMGGGQGYQCRPLRPCDSFPCNNATEVCQSLAEAPCDTLPCPTHKCVPRANYSGTVNSRGKEVADVRHELIGKPERDAASGLTPAEKAACLGAYGPFEPVRAACQPFLDLPVEKQSSSPCPDECLSSLAAMKHAVDSSKTAAKCAKINQVVEYVRRLSLTTCDPTHTTVTGKDVDVVDPLAAAEAADPSADAGSSVADMGVMEDYIAVEYMSPIPQETDGGNQNNGDADGGGSGADGVDESDSTAIEMGAGAGEGDGSGKPQTPDEPLSPSGLEGVDPSRRERVDAAGYCTGDSAALVIKEDGTPVYCLPRESKLRVDRHGTPIYDQSGRAYAYPKRVEWSKDGSVVYPSPGQYRVKAGGSGGGGKNEHELEEAPSAHGEDDFVSFELVDNTKTPMTSEDARSGINDVMDGALDAVLTLPRCQAGGSCGADRQDEYCSGVGRCMRHGVCALNSDCARVNNPWLHGNCDGFAECVEFQCTWTCGGAPEGGEVHEAKAQPEAGDAEDAAKFRALFAHKLESLKKAGYTDEEKNLHLLIKHRGDIALVVGDLDDDRLGKDNNDMISAKTGQSPAGTQEPIPA